MQHLRFYFYSLLTIFFIYVSPAQTTANTFSSLQAGEVAPSTFDALWADYDPRAEPLRAEVIAEWEEDGVILQVVRYLAGVFKGEPAMVAGVYGYAKEHKEQRDLPALINIHGGGQFADAKAVISNAKRGYATLCISWAGRITSSQYRVTSKEAKLLWSGKTDDPAYRVMTDWGAVDGYHAPCRNKRSASSRIAPHELTLDQIESPRNSLWFLATVAARRGITYLEQQQEVDPERIGIYGHSMGGKITVLTAAADNRLKVAVPTCGGISNYQNPKQLYNSTLGDHVNLAQITCPLLFLSPANDFHGDIYDLPEATTLLNSPAFRVSSAPHHNHQDSAPYLVTGFKWIDHYLQAAPALPETPDTTLQLATSTGVPEMTVRVDASYPVKEVNIFYTQQGIPSGSPLEKGNPRFKYWHHAAAVQEGETWNASLPLASTDRELWVYANVTYTLPAEEQVTNYYYAPVMSDEIVLSSVLERITVQELSETPAQATLQPSRVIEDFSTNWQYGWFRYDPAKFQWARKTNKLSSPIWKAPHESVCLAVQVTSSEPNILALRLDSYATELQLRGNGEVETFTLKKEDFKNASGQTLKTWAEVTQLEYAPYISISSHFNHNGITKSDRLTLGSRSWKGSPPALSKLSWEATSSSLD